MAGVYVALQKSGPPVRLPLLSTCRHTLECVYQLHAAAIHSIAVHDGFCLTGSDDKQLRVWPMDFKDFMLEVGGAGARRRGGHAAPAVLCAQGLHCVLFTPGCPATAVGGTPAHRQTQTAAITLAIML